MKMRVSIYSWMGYYWRGKSRIPLRIWEEDNNCKNHNGNPSDRLIRPFDFFFFFLTYDTKGSKQVCLPKRCLEQKL